MGLVCVPPILGLESLDDSASHSDDDGEASAASHSPTKMRHLDCNPLGLPLDVYQHLKDMKEMFIAPTA